MIAWMIAQTDAVSAVGPAVVPSLWRTFGALAVVLALIGVSAWVLRRSVLAKRSGKGLGIESVLALGDRRSLVVVSVEGRRLLLGLAPNAVSLVTELDRTASFDQTLTQAGAPPARPV